MRRIIRMNRCAVYSEDSSSSINSEDSSSTTSFSDDSEVEVYLGPEPKKRKSNSTLKTFQETELNCNLIVKANYRWTIQGFSKVCSTNKTREKIESPDFTVGPNDEMTWRLQLFPNGTTEENKNNVLLNLLLVSSKEEKVTGKCKCGFINNKNRAVLETKFKETFTEGQCFAFKESLRTISLLHMTKMDDILVIACQIIVDKDIKPPHKIKVVSDLGILLDSGNYSDVSLKVESKTFNVHKYILAARSPVFAAMFKHDMKEKSENTVEIPDISYPVMQELLRFTYTGEVKNLDSVAKDLLAAADKYAYEDLKALCESALIKKMNVLNVVEILNFAELHNIEKLKEKALNFFVTKVKDVINTAAFKAVADTQPLLAQVICVMAQKLKS